MTDAEKFKRAQEQMAGQAKGNGPTTNVKSVKNQFSSLVIDEDDDDEDD